MVDQDGLENRYTGNRIEGSNPSLTAKSRDIHHDILKMKEGIR